MPFRFKAKETVEDGLKRIVLEQVEKAVAEIDDEKLPRDEAIHQVRTRCKKIRGAVRLVRPVFGGHYKVENEFFRNAGREVAPLRDAEVMVRTFDAVTHQFRREMDRRTFAPLRQRLVEHRQALAKDKAGQQRRLATVRDRMCQARERIATWKLKEGGFEAIEDGLLQTYTRGRKALRLAYETCKAPDFHEWRKRVKYHRYQLRLLCDLWPPVMRTWRYEVVALSELLGDNHDLAVFRSRLLEDGEGSVSKHDLKCLLGFLDQRVEELRAKARPFGERLFAEKPKQFHRRIRKYWEIWCSE